MGNSQIENTINEIKKRSGVVTVFTIMIFVIGGLMLTDNIVFAQDDDEKTQTGTEYLCNIVNCKLSVFDILIGLGFVILIPMIILQIQKNRKKNSVIGIWKSQIESLASEQASAISHDGITLADVVLVLEKTESLVAESFDNVTYIAYALQVRHIKQLIADSSVQRIWILQYTKNYLEELILFN